MHIVDHYQSLQFGKVIGEKIIMTRGSQSKIFVFVLLLASVLVESTYGMAVRQVCKKSDQICQSKRAVQLTNKIRRAYGRERDLVMGSQAQLRNAVEHAKFMAKKGKAIGQDLVKAEKTIKCERFIGAENVAKVKASGDIAKDCVSVWENSPPAWNNMVLTFVREMVVGVALDKKGNAYCVQTFALKLKDSPETYGSASAKGCKKAM